MFLWVPNLLKALVLCLRDLRISKLCCKNVFWICYGSFLELSNFCKILFSSHFGYSLESKKESFVKMIQLNKMIHSWAGKYFFLYFYYSWVPKTWINSKQKQILDHHMWYFEFDHRFETPLYMKHSIII